MDMPSMMGPPSDANMTPMPAMHAAFFWGHRAQVLFANWPGDRASVGMYVLCLLIVLALAALLEALSVASRGISRRRPNAALMISAVHAAKMGLAYLVMLAVMSFNAGVLLAAVAGHFLGFLLVPALGRTTRGDEAPVPSQTEELKP